MAFATHFQIRKSRFTTSFNHGRQGYSCNRSKEEKDSMASKAQYIIGVDTGGTFTDVVVLSNAGKVWTAKASITPDDFSRGVMDAVAEAARAGGMESAQLLEQTILFKHGSTVATNTLINRSGGKVR